MRSTLNSSAKYSSLSLRPILPMVLVVLASNLHCGGSKNSITESKRETGKAQDAPSSVNGCPPIAPGASLATPSAAHAYHGVYPGSFAFPGAEDKLTEKDVYGNGSGSSRGYVPAANHDVAWVYFSDEFKNGTAFPQDTATWITNHGAIPFIRLMLRDPDRADSGVCSDSVFADFRAHKYDQALRDWGQSAKDFGKPLIVEWGTEMNGRDTFPWSRPCEANALVATDYRQIRALVSEAGATNITWAFHVDGSDDLTDVRSYYPGPDYVDWVGFTLYGAQRDDDDCPNIDDFTARAAGAVTRLKDLGAITGAPKPIFLFEFGTTKVKDPQCAPPAQWAAGALQWLLRPNDAGELPVSGFSWWNERWSGPGFQTNMRLQDDTELARTWRETLAASSANVSFCPNFK